MQQQLCCLEARDLHVPVAVWADHGIEFVGPLHQPGQGYPEPLRGAIWVEEAAKQAILRIIGRCSGERSDQGLGL